MFLGLRCTAVMVPCLVHSYESTQKLDMVVRLNINKHSFKVVIRFCLWSITCLACSCQNIEPITPNYLSNWLRVEPQNYLLLADRTTVQPLEICGVLLGVLSFTILVFFDYFPLLVNFLVLIGPFLFLSCYWSLIIYYVMTSIGRFTLWIAFTTELEINVSENFIVSQKNIAFPRYYIGFAIGDFFIIDSGTCRTTHVIENGKRGFIIV